eukprot:XP_001698700.1 predicted protein [Chlamydomonas reinhardtii]
MLQLANIREQRGLATRPQFRANDVDGSSGFGIPTIGSSDGDGESRPSDRPETVVLTLKRIQSVVRSDYLASRFEGDEGVALLLTCFHERAGEAVLREFLAAAAQLLKYKSTREALLMVRWVRIPLGAGMLACWVFGSSLVERLERAGAAGWLPAELREPARQLFLDAHAARRMEMEGMAAGL